MRHGPTSQNLLVRFFLHHLRGSSIVDLKTRGVPFLVAIEDADDPTRAKEYEEENRRRTFFVASLQTPFKPAYRGGAQGRKGV